MQYVRFHLPVGEGDPESALLIPARHHRVITLGAAYKLYVMEDDAELGASFSSDYDKRIAMMREDLIREQYDVSDHIFVVDEEDWVYDLHPWT
jgi:hypothetical protein